MQDSKIIVSHPTGNSNVRAMIDSFAHTAILHSYYTSIATTPGSFLSKISKGMLAELKRRSYSSVISPYLKQFPWYEAGRMLASKAGWKGLTRHESSIFSVDSVYRKLDAYVALNLQKKQQQSATAVYCYEDGALETFRQARALGLACLYDLPIGYWRSMRRLLFNEMETRPEWAITLTGFNDSEIKLARKDEELQFADHIFVASSFTANTLKDFPGLLAPVSVIPYGFPMPVVDRNYQPLYNRALKVLFVGGLSQRKGIANLLEAVESFGEKVELTIVGNRVVPNCEVLNKALIRHRWIPTLPHSDILQLMRQQDVFIFPSLFEGFGLVITEAMSQGTPVITTERTAGPDIIRNGENGWLTPAGDTEALKNAIAAILEQPKIIQEVGRAAIESAAKRSWRVYGKEMVDAINALSLS